MRTEMCEAMASILVAFKLHNLDLPDQITFEFYDKRAMFEAVSQWRLEARDACLVHTGKEEFQLLGTKVQFKCT